MQVAHGADVAATLPPHAARYWPNIVFVAGGEGYATWINIMNYFGEPLFSPGEACSAIAEVAVLDADGQRVEVLREVLAPGGSFHREVGANVGHGGPGPAMGSAHCRLIPMSHPSGLDAPWISTEFTAEIESPGGNRTFFHNTLGPSRVPGGSSMRSARIFVDGDAMVSELVLLNTYCGPTVPVIAAGRARITITNSRGDRRTARSDVVPRLGASLFSMAEHFPDLPEFLGERSGVLDLSCVNLLRKPWVWIRSPHTPRAFSVEHL